MNRDELQHLLEVSTLLSSTLDLRKLLSIIIEVANELTSTEDASILLFNEKSNDLEFVASTGDVPLDDVIVPLEGSIAGAIVRSGEPMLVEDVQADERHFQEIDKSFHFTTRSILGVPLVAKGETIGVLEVLNKQDGSIYTDEDVVLLQSLASQSAVAIENARLFQQSDLVAEMMHELKTPLLSMSFSVALLKREELPEEERDRVLQMLQRECDRLAKMTADFLDLARLESGRLHLAYEVVSIAELVEDVLHIEAPQAGSRGVTIEADLPEQMPALTGDANRLKQVLLNLVSNAVKYNEEGGRVTVSATLEGRGVCLAIADTGKGIPPENLPHLFDRFYRVPSDENSASGSGLGLSIAKSIVEEHGGRLTVESTVGQGTTFYCWLPRDRKPETMPA